jgi:hypothetical protein
MERLGVETAVVREEMLKHSEATKCKIVPYSAVIYDPHGLTWVYTRLQPRTFVRHQIDVDYIEGDIVVLNDGPPVGAVVATVGVAELYGTELATRH